MPYFFFRKLGKMSQNLSSAAVVIGALRVNTTLSYFLFQSIRLLIRHRRSQASLGDDL